MLSNSFFDENRAKGLCFWCNEKYTIGHQCRKKQIYQITIPDNEECDNASEENKKDESKKTTEQELDVKVFINAITGIPSIGTIMVVGLLKKRYFYILIDSGSTHNFLDPSLLAFSSCEVEPIPIQQVKVANGESMSISQRVTNFQWHM
ncbi:hypothetical protein AXF42_Ash000861 [Apostasia shenzhenica]|uniref:Uncharacterized protein n=1 Tax=Apostasia shenzhenica TaxID=1088818 RepID=A0A2I0AT89_9ASPA|nr:hypothetical protein AXF42_Ash000861 [Apostasia shenzhenica]